MNRRTFFGVTVGAVAAAVCPKPEPRYYRVRYVEYTPTIGPNTTPDDGVIRFKGIPLVFDRDCPQSRITFTNRNTWEGYLS